MEKITAEQNGAYWKNKENIWLAGIRYAAEKISQAEKTTVLDVGCGDGSFFKYLLPELKKRGIAQKAELVGVDACGDYRKSVEKNGAKFVNADALKLCQSIKEKSAGFVVCSEVLEHVDQTDSLIREIRKVMKDDAELFITTPNLASYHARLSLLLGLQPVVTEVSNERGYFGKGFVNYFNGYNPKVTDVPVHHIRVFTAYALKEFLQYHGFIITKFTGSDYRIPSIMRHFPSIAPVLQVLCKKKM